MDCTPGLGRAPMRVILTRYTAMELRLTLRRADSVVVMTIPALLALLGLGLTDVVRLPTDDRLGFIVPGAIALAVMSSGYVGLAVATGNERSLGVLKFLGATALPSWGLLLAKFTAVIVLIGAQVIVLASLGLLLGWRPYLGAVVAAIGLVALATLATLAFAGIGLTIAGRLRAETTTGAVNLTYLLMIVFGNVVFPLPRGVVEGTQLLPVTALAEGMRGAFTAGGGVPAGYWSLLGLWAVTGLVGVAMWFRWE